MRALAMRHDVDPAEDLRAKLKGKIEEVEVFHNLILVAQYVRPDSIDLGGGKRIFLTDQTRKEDEYQGKVGLVLKKGPMAFEDDGVNQFHGQNVQVGDWICFRTSDGWPLIIGDVHCRFLEEAHIKARIASPDIVF